MYSREGKTQGDPIAMFSNGIGILALIKNLKYGCTYVTQPWCADNISALGMFARVKSYFNSSKRNGPG